MKKTGRGNAYENALIKNLVRSLTQHKKIITTVSKARKLKNTWNMKQGGTLKITRLSSSLRKDRAKAEVEILQQTENNEYKTNETKRNTKSMASH